MKLVNTTTLQIEDFLSEELPHYAILSHTWGQDEITFQDMELGLNVDRKNGYNKILSAARQAAKDDLLYVWIDTCCIDKRSSAELQEAINSMYRYYADAQVCYAYLADVSGDCPILEEEVFPAFGRQLDLRTHQGVTHENANEVTNRLDDQDEWRKSFIESKWFTRGWTLQELIAPRVLRFYGKAWNFLGAKEALIATLSNATRIQPPILAQKRDVLSVSVAARMSWAANRETLRKEDQAYCLMGIFGVNMPLLYGEGPRAFIRLQEEIMKLSNDHSIFAWDFKGTPDPDDEVVTDGALLAPSPSYFANCHEQVRWGRPSAYSMTNRGLQISLPVIYPDRPGQDILALLNCRNGNDYSRIFALRLQEYEGSEEQYVASREGRLDLVSLQNFDSVGAPLPLQITREFEPELVTLNLWIPLSKNKGSQFEIIDKYPNLQWDLNELVMYTEGAELIRAGVTITSERSSSIYYIVFGYELVRGKYSPIDDRYISGIWAYPDSPHTTLEDLVLSSYTAKAHDLQRCYEQTCPHMPSSAKIHTWDLAKPEILVAAISRRKVMGDQIYVVDISLNIICELEGREISSLPSFIYTPNYATPDRQHIARRPRFSGMRSLLYNLFVPSHEPISHLG